MSDKVTLRQICKLATKEINNVSYTTNLDLVTIENLPSMEIRPDDVILGPYMRSGTHWVGEMIDIVRRGGDIEQVKQQHIHERIPYLEWPPELLQGTMSVDDYKPNGQVLKTLDSIESPRFLKSHLPYKQMPIGVKSGKCKVIIVLRNPKSVFVSNYCMYAAFPDLLSEKVSLDMVLDSQLSANPDIESIQGSWYGHVSGWWQNREQLGKNILFIKYEDMKKDTAGVISSVSKFLNKDIPEDKIQIIAEHLQIKNMKRNSTFAGVFDGFKKASHIKETKDADAVEASHIRTGTVDDWKRHMKVAQSERVDAYFSNKFDNIGLHFDFE